MSTPKTIQIAIDHGPAGPVLLALRDDGEIFLMRGNGNQDPQWELIKPVPTYTPRTR